MARGLRIGYARAVRVAADGTTYSIAGQTANTLRGLLVTADQGSYAQTGQIAALNIGGAVTPSQTAATINTAGTQISISYSVAVTFGAGGQGGNVITMSGGTSTLSYSSGVGTSTLVYNLSRTIQGGETGTLAYTQPVNGIEAATGLADLVSFSGRTIVNQSIVGSSSGVVAAGQSVYRSNQAGLFVDALSTTQTQVLSGGFGAYETPADPAVAAPKVGFNWGDMAGSSSLGPSYTHVESANEGKWLWVNPGGDWVNTSGTSQGTSNPYFTFTSPAGTNTVSSITATAGAQAARLRGKWNSYIVRASSGNVSLATHHHPSLAAPFMSVTYSDGTTATLACTACVPFVNGSTIGRIGVHTAAVNPSAALQFEMPTKPVSSATVTIVTVNSGSSATVSAYLANPTTNTNTVTTGMASAYTLDSGISGHPSILFTQRMLDGTSISDYLLPLNPNTDNLSLWDPGLYGGADNTNLLPTRYSGTLVAGTNKWLHSGDDNSANVSFVQSSYTGDNFVPAFPGIGALRIVVPKFTGATGSSVGFGLGIGCNLWALFPKAIAGLVSEDYVRFMVRIAGPAKTIANSKMFRTSSGGTAAYDSGSMRVGKWGIGSHHWTRFGGNAQSGGANLGHSNRLGFTYHYADAPLAGIGVRVHSFDMMDGPAAPYRGEDMPIGSIGGTGGAVYPDRWYTMEIRKKLNTYNPSTGASSNDGIMQVWLDGVLVAEHTGWNFRNGLLTAEPLASLVAAQPTLFKPFREMGDFGIAMNHYVGGNHRPDEDFTVFYTMIAAATERIGPVNSPLPTWVPAAGELVTLTTANGKLSNTFASQTSPYYHALHTIKTVNDYSTAFKNPYWGTYGAQVFWGGGHAGTNCNQVTVLEYGASACTFKRVSKPTPWFGEGTDSGTKDSNGVGNANAFLNFTYMESTIDGQPGAPHSYACGDIVGPEYGGSTYGSLVQVGGAAVNAANDAGAFAAHHIQFDTLTLQNGASQDRKWTRLSNSVPGGGWGTSSAPWYTAFVGRHQRVYIATNGMGVPGTVRWFDLVTGTYVVGSGTGFSIDEAISFDSGIMFWVPERDLLICMYPQTNSQLKVQWMSVATGVSQPTVGSAVTLSQTLTMGTPWSAACWCKDNSRIIVAGVSGDNSAVYEIEIPTTLTNTWNVTRAAFANGASLTMPDVTLGRMVTTKKWAYDERVHAIVYMPIAVETGADTVYVYRPRNT